MSLNRSAYRQLCQSTSEVLVEHVIKLLLYKSPENKVQWIVSVAKGFKCDTYKFTGMRKKPILDHLAIVTDKSGNISLEAISNQIYWIEVSGKYKSLPKRNVSVKNIADALLDLINSVDVSKQYTPSQILELVNNWYSLESIKLHLSN